MTAEPNGAASRPALAALPDTPHELPLDRGTIDALVDRARRGDRLDLLGGLLDAVDWTAFGTAVGEPLSSTAVDELRQYYRQKWHDIGPLFLAELLSTEFMTEQRARGDIVFSEQLLQLGRNEPELWQEIRQFFRRKEMVTALLATVHDPSLARGDDQAGDDSDDEEDLWE